MTELDLEGNNGFVRAGAAIPLVKVADCACNATRIIELIKEAEGKGLQFVVFPELSLTAYTCGDLFHQQKLLNEAAGQLGLILKSTSETSVVAMLGMPLRSEDRLYNCAAAIQRGKVLGIVPKTYIPGHREFYEERWFSAGSGIRTPEIIIAGQVVPFGTDLIFTDNEDERICFGIELCEDLWVPLPPSSYLALAGAKIIFNLSASNELVEKNEYRKMLISTQSARCISGYVYASSGTGESTTDIVFGGNGLIYENGNQLREADRFSDSEQLIYSDIDILNLINDRAKNTCFSKTKERREYRNIRFDIGGTKTERIERKVDPFPFVPVREKDRDTRCREVFSIQTSGLVKRMRHIGCKNAVIGISGGLDSTLALLVIVKAFEKLGLDVSGITAVTMPGFGTTGESHKNAVDLMKALNVEIREIDIREACSAHFRDIGHDAENHDSTYENVQARERTQVLMDIANMQKGIAVGTGDLSEIALGWSTYNGDHMSMYSVNCGIPKTLVKYLVEWAADNAANKPAGEVLHRILSSPISPELLPPGENGISEQHTEQIIGPYELHDFFLYHIVRYGENPGKVLFLAAIAFEGKYAHDEIKKWLRVFITRFFSQQYKRSCMPDGPKVGSVALSPRGDWRMPSDASAAVWLKELEA